MAHIVVVAEDAEILSAVQHTLQSDDNLEVFALSDSQAALCLIKERHPDLILVERGIIYKEGLGLPVKMHQVSSAPVLSFARANRTQQTLARNHIWENGLISRIRASLASAGIQAASISIIL